MGNLKDEVGECPLPKQVLEKLKGILEPIAIVGMSCRLPGANSIEEFWDLLMNESSEKSVNPRSQRDSSLKDDGNHIKINFLSVPVDEMDSRLFNLSPAEISFLDPHTRILLEVAWEALEAAGINPTSLRGSDTGVFAGLCADDFRCILNHNSTLTENYFRKLVGSLGGTSTKFSQILGATGPSLNVNAACTSSMVCVDLACQNLRLGNTSLALACGVNLIVQPFTLEDVNGLCAQDGRCKTFDEKADGFGRSEGCTVLILKRLSDAMKNKDHIHGLIRGIGLVQEGITPSMMTPTVHCEALAIKKALENAGVNPSEVSYVEAHGTGTQVGDPMEIEAIAKAYATNDRLEPLIIGSVKTNIGHTESASGIAGIIKTILALENEIIPKHRNLEVLNPKINLQSIPAVIPSEHTSWRADSKTPRIAGVSCFGLTGTESHAIIQESPRAHQAETSKYKGNYQRPTNILSLSAKTPEALEEMLIKYQSYLTTETNSNFADICYSTNTGRAQNFRHRASIVAETSSDAQKIISNSQVIHGKCPNPKPKICFLFPGFGCAYDGMTTEICSSCPVFRENFDKCEYQLQTNWNISFKKYVNGTKLTEKDTANLLTAEYSQTFILVVEYCLFKTWESWGIKPDYILGHSIGEIAATVAAGILKIEDAIDMVVQRNRLMGHLENGGMIAVQANKAKIEGILKYSNIMDLDFAATNTETQTVMSGNTESIYNFVEVCKNKNVKCTTLGAKYAFHSRQVRIISEQTRKDLCNLKCNKPVNCNYISAVYARTLETTEQIDKEYFISNAEGTVRFLEASKVAFNDGCRIFLEMGIPLLSSFIIANCRGFNEQDSVKCIPSLKKSGSEWSILLNSLAELNVNGFDVNWEQFDKPYVRDRVQVPLYPFQRKKYALPVPSNMSGNIGRDKSKRLHPLLGERLSIASDFNVYQVQLNLVENPYLSDHKIGELIIFPGAVFLEIALAAGFAHKSNAPITVTELVIKTPLCIEDSIDLQIIVKPQHDDGLNVEICSLESKTQDKGFKWIQHSQAFLIDKRIDEDVKEFKRMNLKSSYGKEHEYNMAEHYKAKNNAGLKFGPHFRSLQKVWKIGGNLVAEINVPQDSADYLIHPILSDAIFQAVSINSFPNDVEEIRVPIAINQFIWFKKPQVQIVYAYAYQTGDSKNAALLDSDNNLLALMKGISFAKTTAQSISDQVLGNRTVKLPSIFEEIWKPAPLSGEKPRIISKNPYLNSQQFSVIISENEKITTEFETRLQKLRKTPIVFMISEDTKIMKLNNNWTYINKDNSLEAALIQIFQKYGYIEQIIYIYLESANREQERITKPLVELSKILLNYKSQRLPDLFILTQGISPIGDYILANPFSATLHGIAKTLRNELPSLCCKVIDMDYSQLNNEKAIDEVLTELWTDDNENHVAYRNRCRFVPKLVNVAAAEMSMEALDIPVSTYFKLELPTTKAIRDLKLVSCPQSQLQDTEIQVQVKASGLNFKDILTVLKPTHEFDDVKEIGLEFAGAITSIGKSVTSRKIGDAVFGWVLKNGTLQSHVTVASDSVINIPTSWTFADAATLPVVFKTAYYCLVTVGKLQAGETILIHTGSGGVGLCAIQLAKYLGANIITTAGSNRKREHLKHIGVSTVFNSRTLDYGKQILEITSGKGVDFVLNSLTGPGFKETSLEVCAPNARFIEMSKLDIWSREEVTVRRPDVKYQIIDVSTLPDEVDKMLLEHFSEMIANEIIKPLPHLTFGFTNTRNALQYLQNAKHIGKVVVEMPRNKMKNGNAVQSSDLFNDRSTYLITGGLGGIGLTVAKWMANSGAKFIVLVGRNRPNKTAQEIIESLTVSGKQIICLQGNVGKHEECKQILDEIKCLVSNLPPLRGIMHCAGVIDSALLSKINWSNFESTFDPKVNGGWNLHDLTKNDYNLQHFVLFSSAVAHLGLSGLSNHCAANCFLDSLAHHRNSIGLPALSVNWGQWGQVGVAADMKITGQFLIQPNEAIYALETLMRNHSIQKCVVEMDVNVVKSVHPNLKGYLEGFVTERKMEQKTIRPYKLDKEVFLQQLTASDNKQDVVLNQLDLILRQVLMLSSQDQLDKDETFKNLGMDSLMSVQIKNAVELLTNHQDFGISDFISEDQTLANLSADITIALLK